MVRTRPEEQFAFEVMRRTLGIEVTDHDDNSEPAMVDGHFTLNGRRGAAEVTTAVDQEWMQVEAIIGDTELEIAGLQWSWHVMVGTGVGLADLRHHLAVLLSACEQQRVVRPDYLLPHPDFTDSYTWYFTHDIDAAAVPESKHPGKIYLVPAIGGGGAVPDDLGGFPAWLEEQLALPRFASDLAKLADSGRPEQHLFLRVHGKWWPFQFDYLIGHGDTIPSEPFNPPHGLTGLWLATRWKNPILYWTAAGGWARTDAYD